MLFGRPECSDSRHSMQLTLPFMRHGLLRKFWRL